mmetsp:Transcript_18309/g.18568  ORF Transcript_18309/g.18568 Transcript_18309/m.18568 type:complete len:87 (-) Transcript_18309:218-478(-)
MLFLLRGSAPYDYLLGMTDGYALSIPGKKTYIPACSRMSSLTGFYCKTATIRKNGETNSVTWHGLKTFVDNRWVGCPDADCPEKDD